MSELTNCQANALIKLNAFMQGKDKFIVLSGAGGTGKTYLIQSLLRDTINLCRWQQDKIHLVAPTHKALSVLDSAFDHQYTSSTIHSLFGLTLKNDNKTGKIIPNVKDIKVQYGKLLIIDECSMINKEIYNILLNHTPNCKIIFVGDIYQLPPIREKISLCFNHKTIYLKEMIRQKQGSFLNILSNEFRANIDENIIYPIEVDNTSTFRITEQEFKDHYIEKYFKNKYHNNKLICYTNNRVSMYSKLIRSKTHSDPRLKPNDRIMLKDSYYCDKSKLTIPQDIPLEISFLSNPIYSKQIELTGKSKALGAYSVTVPSIKHYICRLEGYEKSKILIPCSKKDYEDLLTWFAKQKLWAAYFYLKETYVSISTIDCMTIHKTQGSTFNTVFIDLNSTHASTNHKELLKLLYVAISRAKHKIYFIGDLKPKLINSKGVKL